MRLATFNIQHARTPAGNVDLPLFAATCARLRADVLALQEVDRRVRRSRWADLAARAARASEMRHRFGGAVRIGRLGRYGNALLVRGTLSDLVELELPRLGAHEPRLALLATAVLAGGEDVSVAAVHLSVHLDESQAQLVAVTGALLRRPSPRVLLGDLNRRPEQLDALAGAGFEIAGGPPTFPAAAPRVRIDHVAVDHLAVLGVDIVSTPVSDHRALVVEAR